MTPRVRYEWMTAIVIVALLAAIFVFRARDPMQQVPYSPAVEVETSWGRLVTVANVGMPGRPRERDRVGFFQSSDGTVWGLPLETPDDGGEVRACAPGELRSAAATDTLPLRVAEIIGASDFFRDRRSPAFGLYLLTRDDRGVARWHRVRGGEFMTRGGVSCREPATELGSHRDPIVRFSYFRIVPR